MRFLAGLIFTLITAIAISGQQSLQKGTAAPEFTAQTLTGRQLSTKDLQGKVIVLTFWSTRCEICHVEMPKLNQVAERYRGKDVVFIAATMEGEAKIEPYLRKTPFSFDIVPNSFGIVLKYADMDRSGNINMGFPAYYVINKKGLIEHRSNGWDKTAYLDSQIGRLLAE